jgi:hypothetical protein
MNHKLATVSASCPVVMRLQDHSYELVPLVESVAIITKLTDHMFDVE